MPQHNLAVNLLRKLLQHTNLVQLGSFRRMLGQPILSYQNCAFEVTEIIAELVKLAQEMRESHRRGENLLLSEAERHSKMPWNSTKAR